MINSQEKKDMDTHAKIKILTLYVMQYLLLPLRVAYVGNELTTGVTLAALFCWQQCLRVLVAVRLLNDATRT